MNRAATPEQSATTQQRAPSREGSLVGTHEPAERRRKPGRRWFGRERRGGGQGYVGIVLTPQRISLAVARQWLGKATPEVVFEEAPLPMPSAQTSGQWWHDELGRCLLRLVERHQLHGLPVTVALGGHPCVTRSWFGENAAVDENIRELTTRIDHYLALGRGEKVFAYWERAADAKRKRAWVTIAHRGVVEAVAKATQGAGMRLIHVHHTLPMLCHLIGRDKLDAQAPVLIALEEDGYQQLAISFKGQLILDYRAPHTDDGTNRANGVVETIRLHLKRLRRFAAAQLPRDCGELSRVCVLSRDELPANIDRQLQEELKLEWLPFPPDSSPSQGIPPQRELVAADRIVATSIATEGLANLVPISANLADSLKSKLELNWRQVASWCWPVAATVFLAVAIHGYAWYRQTRVEALVEQIEELAAEELALRVAEHEFERTTDQLHQLQELQKQARNPGWAQLVRLLGRALPDGAWVQQLTIVDDNRWQLRAASLADAAAHVYIERLQSTGAFSEIALESLRETEWKSGPGFEFQVTGRLVVPLPRTATSHTAGVNLERRGAL
ncbi:MAG: hypothetical protein KatS3mg111_3213 [Pirellulaceae bacterium]|nr:MAG: hypothetical protein KatS3mg111_3213 [Pirellulaceae bacterium]